MEEKHPLIKLPLPIFIENHLRDHWCGFIDKTIGSVIAKIIDKEEKYCHVEFYDPTTIDIDANEIIFECRPSAKDPAVLWKIIPWRDSVTYRERRRNELAKDTEEYKYVKKKIAELSIAIHEKTALPYHGEYGAITLARKLILTKNKIGAKNFGVEL